jgi:hypothetical protein
LADDVVKKITITATGEHIDETRASTEKLSTAVTQLSNQTAESAKAYKAQTDALNSNTSAMGSLWQQIVAGGLILGALKLAWDGIVATLGLVVSTGEAILRLGWDTLMFVPNYLAKQWTNTTERLAEYIALAQKAGSLDISTGFYQSQTVAAEKLKITNDSIIKQMETLRTATADKLGGSTGQNRVDELVKFGNFDGNTGVGALKSATTQEEKYKAVVSLIDQAIEKGERLAAIDVAKTMLGADAAANLEKDSAYFDKIQSSADKLTGKDLVADADVSRALDLANRLQAAEDIISKKWFPSQRDGLNPLVMFFKEMWVEIVELIAGAFNWVEKITKSMLSIPSDLWAKFQNWRHAGEAEGPQQETPDQALSRATANLRTGLQNKNTVDQAGRQTLSASDKLRPDKSHAAAPDEEDNAAYERATEQLLKYIKVTDAAALSVDAGAGAQERLKATAQLMAAAEKDGTTVTAELAKEMDELATRAGNAADALAKARVASQIKFGRNTALLSPEDVSIATQLKHIYPDVTTALNSLEAQGLRTNAALSGVAGQLSGQLTSGITDVLDGTKSLSQGFADLSKVVVRAIEEMIVKLLIVGPLMRALQSSMGGLGGLFNIGSNATDGIGGFGPTAPPGFANGTNDAPGGWSTVGENGPERMYVPKGSTIVPNGVPSDGGNVNAPVTIHIDATGADAAGLARLQEQIAALQRNLPATIVKTVQKAKTNRVL